MTESQTTAVTFHRYSTFEHSNRYYWEVAFTTNHPLKFKRSFAATFKEIYTYTMDIVQRNKLAVKEAHICSWMGYEWGPRGMLQPGIIIIPDIKNENEMAILILQLA